MNMLDIITKKRDGLELTTEEIQYFIRSYVSGEIPDYQAAALLMAIYFQKLTRKEIFALTEAMEYSGDVENLGPIPGIKIDKHSTGGVGDKTTLIVGPIAAAAGVTVAKMSGRGLGFTGGTADKLEAIPGFQTTLTPEAFQKQLEKIGLAVITQSGSMTPADKKLYALRDVTGTVENPGLIASSIMSKKLASGSDGIVLDVKCGNGAFLKDEEAATELAELMMDIGKSAGKRMVAVISDMNQPLGQAVGNTLEVEEAIQVLQGKGPEDVRNLCLQLAAEMIYLGDCAESPEAAYALAESKLSSGAALQKFLEMVEMQGGDTHILEGNLTDLNEAYIVASNQAGYVASVDTEAIGHISQHLGAGRLRKEDSIDPSAGIELMVQIGDAVQPGDMLGILYTRKDEFIPEAEARLRKAVHLADNPVAPPRLIKKIIR